MVGKWEWRRMFLFWFPIELIQIYVAPLKSFVSFLSPHTEIM